MIHILSETTLIAHTSTLKKILRACLGFLQIILMQTLETRSANNPLVFLWALIVPPYWQTLYSYEAEFVQKLLRDKNKKLAVSFNLTYRYIDDVLSINNHNFHNCVHLIYPEELDIKDTTESDISASYLDILLNIDSNGRLTTTLYDTRDDFNFAIVNFPFLCSNTPLSPAYGVYISQLIRYTRTCSAYENFLNRGQLLTKKLMLRDYNESRLK